MVEDENVFDGAASGGIQRLTSRLYDALVRDMVSQAVVQWRLDSKRRKSNAESVVCSACGHRCPLFSPGGCSSSNGAGGDKEPSAAALSAPIENGKSAPSGPSSGSTSPESSTSAATPSAGGHSQAGKPDLYAQNPLFECVVCSRQVSSNRYAVHLAKCLGIGTSGKAASAARKQALSARNSPAPNASDASRLLLSTPRVKAALEARKRLRAPDGHLFATGKRGEASGRGGRGRQKKVATSAASRTGHSTVFAASPLNPNVPSARDPSIPNGTENLKSHDRGRPKLKTSSSITAAAMESEKKHSLPVEDSHPSPTKPKASSTAQARMGSPESQRSSAFSADSGEDSWDSGSEGGSHPLASQSFAQPPADKDGPGSATDDENDDNGSELSDDSMLDD